MASYGLPTSTRSSGVHHACTSGVGKRRAQSGTRIVHETLVVLRQAERAEFREVQLFNREFNDVQQNEMCPSAFSDFQRVLERPD